MIHRVTFDFLKSLTDISRQGLDALAWDGVDDFNFIEGQYYFSGGEVDEAEYKEMYDCLCVNPEEFFCLDDMYDENTYLFYNTKHTPDELRGPIKSKLDKYIKLI